MVISEKNCLPGAYDSGYTDTKKLPLFVRMFSELKIS